MSLHRICLYGLLFSMSIVSTVNAQNCATNSEDKVICGPPGGGAAKNNNGEVVTGPGKCLVNDDGDVICSQFVGGGAAKDSFGSVKTGPGQCIMDSMNKVMCSSQQGGGAELNSMGQAVCEGGCVDGQ